MLDLAPISLRRRAIRGFGQLHAWAYEASDGRIGATLQGLPMLLLHQRGRKSGEPRHTALLTLRDGEDFVVVASFYGSAQHPAWYLNLLARPDCEIRFGRRRTGARARSADAAERARLWPRLLDLYPDYAEYQRRTEREIPVVVLTPSGSSASPNGA